MKSWSNRQGSVATSSGEAEYYAVVKAGAEAWGVQSLAADLGWKLPIEIFVDSSVAKAIASRLGVGKVRHMEVRFLWVQELVNEGKIVMKKVATKDNVADLLTKPLPLAIVQDLFLKAGLVFV